MEVEKWNLESPSDKGFLQYVDLSELKKLITALRRTPRRGNFVDTQLSDVYVAMADRKMSKDDTIETFAERVLDNLNHEQWNEHMHDDCLKGTLPWDGNTYWHTKLQRWIAKKYMKHDLDWWLLSADDVQLLDLAFLIHDVGEALRGDVNFPDKNLSSEQFEKQCGEYLFQKILKPEYRDPDSPEYKRLQEAYDVNFNASHRLNPIFKLYEEYSYLNGTMLASKHPKSIAKAPAMVQEILGYHLPSVLDKGKRFPSAAAFLKDNVPAINDMFSFVERNLFAKKSEQENVEKGASEQEESKQQNLDYAHAKDLRFSNIENEFYHAQHLENWLKKTSLIDDNMFQVLYPKEGGKSGFYEFFALQALSSFTEVVPITEPYRAYESKTLKNGEMLMLPTEREKHKQLLQFEQQMKEVILALRDRSVMFVFDHPTFANIPIWIGQLFHYAKLFDMGYVVDNIYTIVWPALMTQSHRKIILPISHVLKTIPNTDNAKLPIPDKILAQIRKPFRNILMEKWLKAWNIFLLAPTGQRDTKFWNFHWEIASINFGDDTYENIPSSLKLVEGFSKKWWLVVMVGTNETNIKDPLQVKEKGNNRVKWNTYVSMKALEKDEVSSLIAQKQFMPTLASLIKNRNGTQVGNAVDATTLNELQAKKNQPTVYKIESDFLSAIDFKDMCAKMITRKIFNLLKDYSEWDVKSQISRVFHKNK